MVLKVAEPRHKEINIICKKLSQVAFVEVVTNGDTLTPKVIHNLYANNSIPIMVYDGEHQLKNLIKMKEKAHKCLKI